MVEDVPASNRASDLFVPDRFEALRDSESSTLRTIIVPVPDSLNAIDDLFDDMRAARRGGFLILRGETGSGKSTFLDTVGLFRQGVTTERIPAGRDLTVELKQVGPTSTPRILVMETREALGIVSAESVESDMHAINAFLRSADGTDTLVVWPTNTDNLTELLVKIAKELGGEALFGPGEEVLRFSGPAQSEFRIIAEKTVGALNDGATLDALGISEERAEELSGEAETIGRYLALVRKTLTQNQKRVRALLPVERFRMWVVVITGNDSEGDVAALTRGAFGTTDVSRAMSSTGANIVEELKKYPDQVGILGTVLDSKIIHIDVLTALAVARLYGDTALHDLMRAQNMTVKPSASDKGRIESSELGLLLGGKSLATRKRGPKPGSGTQTAFANLAKIAQSDDGALNRAIAAGLVATGLIKSFETEKSLGTSLTYYSDIYAELDGGPIRLEVMWRLKAGRADIANYTLGKLGSYGRAIGLLT
ncbi:hypothetical protein GCM10023215_67160 [Pseudonocardia yuanmonensis]|uniref:Uncharacterized protein n=1 Tax=Pseudonocardia yuanmonensis TaxID=1095914 RepID=A0ABP8XW72_9PSEU